ncbi:MAG: M23 family metallopeptidase [Spirochaetales bacterium]|nr:M23 family metallopeptidase [Spirochaetales bacterium]
MNKRHFGFLIFFLTAAGLFAEGQLPVQTRFSFPKSIRAGDVAEVVIWSPHNLELNEAALENAQGKVLDRAQTFAVPAADLPEGLANHVEAALLATDALSPDQTATFVVFNAQKTEVERSEVQIVHRTFPTEIVHLNPVMTKLREYPNRVERHQAESIWKIYLTNDADCVFQTGLYALPFSFQPRRSALFGDSRTYVYSNGKSSTTYHRGYDFAVPRGTPVLASGRGRVVMARFREMTGGTVVIEHLPGLYSDYFHMDRLDVHVGQLVRQGDKLGLSGATGLVTGPHLHWEFRLHGYSVDGERLLKEGILDKERLAKLFSTAER